jgi:hypothetical protein
MKANLTKNKITIAGLITLLSLTTACFDTGKVEQSEADTNLIVGLLAGQEQGRNALQGSLIAIRGSWEQYSCSNGNCPTTGNPGARVYIKSEPGTNRGVFYQENPPTCFTDGGCTTPNGQQFSGFFPADRSIESFSNTDKRLLYKNARSTTASFSYLLWGTLDGDIYTCDVFQGSATIEIANSNLAERLNGGNLSTDPTRFKSNGCNGFGWNLWKKRDGVI